MPTNLHIEWGERLRARREELGLSQNEVARRAGVPSGYYWRIEAGQVGTQGPSDDVRMRIAAAVDSRVEDIWVYPAPERKAS